MKFRNANGYEEDASAPWLWCFLFGPLYFAIKGVWPHAVVLFAISIGIASLGGFAFVIGPIVGVLYAIFASDIVEAHYLRSGWRRIK